MKEALKDIKQIKSKIIILNDHKRIYDTRSLHNDKMLLIESVEALENKIKQFYLKK